jgi:hypothetical protein
MGNFWVRGTGLELIFGGAGSYKMHSFAQLQRRDD